MSEIPYVNQLGDAFDEAIARRARAPRLRRLGRRRYLAVALAALTVAAGGAALAERLRDPAELGLGHIACYSGPGKTGDVAVVGLGDPRRSPVEICGALAGDGLTASDLIACSEGSGIVVLRRQAGRGCRRMGFAPLPAAYLPSRQRVARLRDLAVALEVRAGCVAPRELARRLEVVLRDAGWTGWRAVIRRGEGPCGRLSGIAGSDVRNLRISAERRTVAVFPGMPLRLERLIYGSGSPGASLFDSSGERCFTVAGLRQHARDVLASARVPIRFTLEAMPANQGTEPPRGDRYAEGCAIYVGAYPTFSGGHTEIVVELRQRGAAG